MVEQIGVDKTSVVNWEANRCNPEIRYMPPIIRFLGYDPLPHVTTLGERLVWRRITLGLTKKEAAQSLAVDPGTLAKWERGEREPVGRFLDLVKRFLDDDRGRRFSARRAG